MVSRETWTISEFLDWCGGTEEYFSFVSSIKKHGGSCSFPISLLWLFLSSHFRCEKKPFLVRVQNDDDGLSLYEFLVSVFTKNILFFPKETSGQSSFFTVFDRLEEMAFHAASNKVPQIWIVSDARLNEPSPLLFAHSETTISLNCYLSYEQIIFLLEESGYSRANKVSSAGDFALRGAIIDLFPPSQPQPVRIEFEYDRIVSLRKFSANDQTSFSESDSVEISPLNPEKEKNVPLLKQIPSGFLDLSLCNPNKNNGLRDGPIKQQRRVFCFANREDRVNQLVSKFNKQAVVVWIQVALPENMAFAIGDSVIVSDGFVHQNRQEKNSLVHQPSPKPATAPLVEGDFVVHEDYGVGRFLGLQTIKARGSLVDMLKIEYKNNENVYVSVEKFHKVQKYAAATEVPPKISSLSNKSWIGTRAKVRRSVEQFLAQYVDLYAKRADFAGFPFVLEDDLLERIKTDFPHTETDDQTKAIRDVFADMQKPKPMERLVVGDVGFGKTEIALRAAALAVLNGKQAAVLCPTTILAEQHFLTFRARLEKYSFRVAVLTRFQTPKEVKQIVRDIALSKIDIVIGTLKILSKHVVFKNLGLLVIDEEHRLGVKTKERLKEIFPAVDVLSMSATPIPRSLHLSLLGARGFSLMETPPRERVPVITEVLPQNDSRIQRSIEHEISRGGRVFYVHNRIETIDRLAQKLRSLLPKIKIGVIHGRMKSADIDRVFLRFLRNEIDCLVSTLIVESGLDIPNANTMIIDRADLLGLAQLYQLRGRVGRGNRQAYVYMLIPARARLPKNSSDRLRSLQSFSGLGDGFAIAKMDLAVRGAGDLFGTRQSGNIARVGFALYNKILNEAIENLSSGSSSKKAASRELPTVQYDKDLRIPENYIEDDETRFCVYRDLSSIEDKGAIEMFRRSILDRFGKNIPQEMKRLLLLKEISLVARSCFVKKLLIREQALSFSFDGERLESFLSKLMKKHQRVVRFSPKEPDKIRVVLPSQNRLNWIVRFFKSLV